MNLSGKIDLQLVWLCGLKSGPTVQENGPEMIDTERSFDLGGRIAMMRAEIFTPSVRADTDDADVN